MLYVDESAARRVDTWVDIWKCLCYNPFIEVDKNERKVDIMARVSVEKNISYDDVKKLYYVYMDYGKDENGKRIRNTKTFQSKSEAKIALKEFEADKTKGTLVIPKTTNIKEWLEYWMNNIVKPNRQQATIYGYQQMIDNHILPALGSISIQQLKPKQIQQYYTMLMTEKGLSPNSARKHHDLLKTAFKLAVKQDILISNPVEKVDPPKIIRKEIRYYKPDELIRLFELVKGDRLETVVKLAGYLGLRREEICGLKWDRIDLNNRLIHINSARTAAGSQIIEKCTKNESSNRTLYIQDELFEILKQEKTRQDKNKEFFGKEYIDEGYVVVQDNGKPYRPNRISEIFTKFIKDKDMPQITLHGLRHTFASIANSANATVFDISKALGHSTSATTAKIYMHMLDKTHEETLKKVAGKLK